MNFSGRPVGVRVPQNQSNEQAPTMTVTRVARLELALVEYGDERGLKHTTVAIVAGDRAYLPPEGERWTAGFRSFAKAINDQIISRLAPGSPSGTVPVQDAVDVLPTSDEIDGG